MTIIKRLRLSYFLLVFVPFTLFFGAGLIIKDIYLDKVSEIKLSVQTLEFNRSFYKILGSSPDLLFEDSTLDKIINMTTAPEDIMIYVFTDGEMSRKYGRNDSFQFYKTDNIKYINYWLFNNSSGDMCEIFIINTPIVGYNHFIPFIGVLIFYISLIIFLSFHTAKKITKPLTKLKNAAISIKNEEFDIALDYNGNDEINDVFTAFNDMRIRLKHIVQKQLQYEQNRTELISNISHDLRTPITSIKGYVEGLMDGVANTPEKVNRYHQTLYKKITLLDKLIENLFLFSKLDLKTIPFNFQKIDIALFLSDILEELRYDNPEMEISYNSIKNPLFVSADPIQLQRVLHNLIGNAQKYCDKKVCNVKVTVQKEKEMARVSVEDNGSGISQENITEIFKRFYRSDPARSSTTEGSGLGLAISKRIITEHNGDIFANNNLKEGLTVTFLLPVIEG